MTDPCPVCGRGDYRLYLPLAYALRDQTYDLVRCRSCGLVRVEPLPDAAAVRSLYGEEYFTRDFSCGVRKGTYLESGAMRVEEYREILAAIRRFRPRGRLLEVGCAAGSFLNYAERSGYEVEGVDISAWAADMAREQFGIKVTVGRLAEAGFADASFDVAFFGDLVEHEPDPVGLIREVHRVLKPGGLIAIKAPTYVNSFYFRLARLFPVSLTFGLLDTRVLQALKLMHQHPQMPPYHLYEYSRRLIERLLRQARFEVVGHQTSLLVPEFLERWNASRLDRAVLLGFKLLRALVVRLNLPAGHVLVFGQKG
jgi:SAM-dependent methyltransferase